MKRSLFVVEGQTEQIFILKFIEKLVATGALHINLKKLHGGEILEISARGLPIEQATHFIQILNVEGDEQVNSFIDDNLARIKSRGFHAVYGLRDRYNGSSSKQKIDTIRVDAWAAELQLNNDIEIGITIAIEEIEAWFLLVPQFFQAYDRSLTSERVNEILGIDLSTCNIDAIEHPAQTINLVLQAVGKQYKKRLNDSHKISDALDYETLYLVKAAEIPALGRFTAQLTAALP